MSGPGPVILFFISFSEGIGGWRMTCGEDEKRDRLSVGIRFPAFETSFPELVSGVGPRGEGNVYLSFKSLRSAVIIGSGGTLGRGDGRNGISFVTG